MSNNPIINTSKMPWSITLFNNDQATDYSLFETPAIDSPLVIEAQENILRQLSISRLIDDLYNAADFMYLAFNALAGTDLWSDVSRLQKLLLDITGETMTLLEIFSHRAKEVNKTLIFTYQLLIDAQDELALAQFKYCGKIAEDMTEESHRLATFISEVVKDTNNLIAGTIERQVANQIDKENLLQTHTEIQAQIKAAEVFNQKIQEDIEALAKDFEESMRTIRPDGWFVNALISVNDWFHETCGTRDIDAETKKRILEFQLAYQETKLRYEDQQLDNMRKLHEYVSEIAKLQGSIGSMTAAIQTFQYAVKALSNVVASLSDAELFWFSIKIYCKQLKESVSANSVHNYQALNLTESQRFQRYTSVNFTREFVTSMAEWVALDKICFEYLVGIESSNECKGAKGNYAKVVNYIKMPPSLKTSKSITLSLANKILERTDKEIQELEVIQSRHSRLYSYNQNRMAKLFP
jgi:hypothetical protein